MAHFLRGKQAGIQNDLSGGLGPDLFCLDDFARYGINSQISAIAYDPVQSLLSVGTSDTQYGGGQIYVFGQQRTCVTFALPRKGSCKILQFCADKIVSVDSKNEICIFSLETKKLLASYSPPGHVTSLLTDPSLDYAFIGLQSGDIVAYDVDRESLSAFRVPNLWRERNPRSKMNPVVTMAFHPRDIGTMLVGFPEGAVLYSFKQNKPVKYFQYEVPSGAPGGGSDPSSARESKWPKLTQAVWHPTGTFILTAHDDSSLVFWDPKDGRVIMARTIQDVNVDKPGSGSGSFGATPGTFSLKEPFFEIKWCCKENPDDTGLLIAGGCPTTRATKGLTFFDLGPTPNYQTSSWQVLSKHFESPRNEHILHTPPGAEVVDFCLIPRSSPHFAGASDPIAVIALLSSGELVTMSFPSGHPISPTNMLHLSLSFVHPFVTKIALTSVDRTRWLGMTEKRIQGPKLLKGGVESKKHLRRFEGRNIAQTAHADGLIRIWDTGHNDDIENPNVLQVDLRQAVGRAENVEVTHMSMAGAAGELSVGLASGELVVFRWGRNKVVGQDIPPGPNEGPGCVTDITHRADPGLKEGFIPTFLINQQQGPITALKQSDVGFICVGFEAGGIAVIDLRVPAVIFTAHSSDFSKPSKRSSILRRRSQPEAAPEWPTSIEFGVMTLDGDDYSSILCFVGTSRGHFATFKILPSGSGAYIVNPAGSCALGDRVLRICPMNSETGEPADASQSAVSNLKTGLTVDGVVIVITPSDCRIFKPATSKGAHKSWDEFMCDSATIVKTERSGYSLVGLFGDGTTRAYSIPGLKEIGSSAISQTLDVRRLGDATISHTGDILGWVGPSEVAMMNVWGTGLELRPSDDQLFNVNAVLPPRPTISNFQWMSGTQFISPSDMDILIGGPDRPPSKRMLEQMRVEEQEQRAAAREGRATSSSAAEGSQEGYMSYMQRQVQERTEKLNIMGDNMDRLEDNSQGWVNDVNKYVQNQKRKALFGVIGSKFGL